MRILLLDPPYEYLVRPSVQIPLGLLYVASSLERDKRNEVGYMDLGAFTANTAVEQVPHADVFGFTGTILDYTVIEKLSVQLKEKYPDCKIMIGGSVSLLTEIPGTINHDIIDAVIKFEGEITVHDVIEDFRKGKWQKVYLGRRILDLDSLPYPARHLVDEERHGVSIFYHNRAHKMGGSTNIMASRGCYYDCSFCGSKSLWDRKVTSRDPKEIVKEMKHCKDNWGIEQFRFSDDNVTMNRKWIEELCKEISKIEVVWRVSIRTRPGSYELFKMMVDAGCMEASFGVESFDDNVMRVLKKGARAKHSIEALQNAKKAGLTVRALFMCSTPGETYKKTVDLNIAGFEEVRDCIDAVPLKTFVPIPGTDIFKHPEQYGIKILDNNYDNYNPLLYGKDGENEITSVISIDSMDREQQFENIKRMRDYFSSVDLQNKG